MAVELPAALITYLADRETARADRVQDFLDDLTSYERDLVHDASVMGYVQGLMRDRSEGIPKDRQTMALVIDACFAHADLYPTVNAEHEERSSSIEYFVQCQQPDGSWAQSSSTTADAEAVVEWRAAKRQMLPDFEFRIARRTTRVIVEAERTGEPS